MKIVVIGAGGIGGYVGGRLVQQGHDVVMVARGAHLDALQNSGLTLNLGDQTDHLPNIRAVGTAAEAGLADLILFTVKLPDTDAAARDLPAIMQDHTCIITLQNGIDGKRLIARHVDDSAIAAASIILAASISNPGEITALAGMKSIAIDGLNGDPVIAAFAKTANDTGFLDVTTSDDVDTLIWSKFVIVSASSGIAGLTRLPLGFLRRDSEITAFYEQLMDETISVAHALGHSIGPEVKARGLEMFHTQPGSQKASLLTDLEAGKKTEVEFIAGRIHRLGQELGVPTPGHSAVWIALSPYKDGPPELSNI